MNKINHYLLDLYRDLYVFEIERKNELNNRIVVPLTITTLLFGLLGYYFKNIKNIALDSVSGILFLVFLSLFVFSLVAILINISKFYSNNTYHYIPPSNQFNTQSKKLINYYNEKNPSESEESLNNYVIYRLDLNLLKNNCKAASKNREANNARLKRLNKSFIFILISILLGTSTAIPFFFSLKQNIQEIEIVNLNEHSSINIMEVNKMNVKGKDGEPKDLDTQQVNETFTKNEKDEKD